MIYQLLHWQISQNIYKSNIKYVGRFTSTVLLLFCLVFLVLYKMSKTSDNTVTMEDKADGPPKNACVACVLAASFVWNRRKTFCSPVNYLIML